MKKNVMMRVAAILLVCVLASTCGISGTFAKYVTSAETSDTARVAKWGVTLTGLANAFAEAYDEGENIKTVVSANYDMDVDDEDNVVAPGTSGTLVKFEVGGEKPEVSYEMTFAVANDAETIFTNWSSTPKQAILVYPNGNPEGYYPILGTLKIGANGQANIQVGTDRSMENLVLQIVNLAFRYDAATGKYSYTLNRLDANPQWLPLDGLPIIEVTWRWAFEYEDKDSYPYKGRLTAEQVDDADTVLGNLAAGMKYYTYDSNNNASVFNDGEDYNLEIRFTVTATITQID